MKNVFYEIYRLLDLHPLALVDCGELCEKRCCCYKFPEEAESGMELIPGEETVFPLDSGWLRHRLLTGEIYDYPPEWGDSSGCTQIRCTEPCPREARPVNCRLFPFQICLLKDRYHLVLTGVGLGYDCPLVDRPELINPAFVNCAKQAARLLLGIPRFRQLVEWDSKSVSINELNIIYAL